MNKSFKFKEEMAVNVKWAGLGQIVGYILQFVVWAILARLLPPENFGALGIALTISNLALIFNEMGMSSAIIQKKELTEKHTIVTFWIGVAISLVFLVLSLVFSRLISRFFQDTAISLLIVILAFKILIDSLGIVHETLLRRELLFKKVTLIEIYSSLVFGAVAIVMAFKGFGIVSMAWGYLAKSTVKVILLWRSIHFHPHFEFDKTIFDELFTFGKNIVGFKILNYLANSIDIVLIGKFLGPVSLGYYSLALNLVNFPRQKLSLIVSQVAFPVFSKVQDHKKDVHNAYLKLIRYASVINFPLLAGLMLVSPQFVRIVYSSKWAPMVLPLQILCVYGICFSITTLVGIVFNSIGHPEYSFRIYLIIFAGVVLAILGSIKYGLTGVAVSLSIYSIFINIIGHLMVGHIVKMNFISYLQAMAPAAISTVVMSLGLVLLAGIQKYVYAFSDIWFLCIMTMSGIVIYILSIFLVSRQTVKELAEIVHKMF